VLVTRHRFFSCAARLALVSVCRDNPPQQKAVIDLFEALCYTLCVQETITIRPTIPKAKLIKKSGGNLNKWINGLIEQAMGERSLDWEEHFRRPRRKVKFSSDAIRKASH